MLKVEWDPRIDELVESLRAALQNELDAREKVADAQSIAESIRVDELDRAAEAISGKNADERARAQAVYLAGCDAYQVALARVARLEHAANLAEIDRKATEAEIGLYKAWLYSQARIG